MKKIIFLIFITISLFLFSSAKFAKTNAQDTERCTFHFYDENSNFLEEGVFDKSSKKIDFFLTINDASTDSNASYTVKTCPRVGVCEDLITNQKVTTGALKGIINIEHDPVQEKAGVYRPTDRFLDGRIEVDKIGSDKNPICMHVYKWAEPIKRSASCVLTKLEPATNITPDKELKIFGEIADVHGIKNYEIFSSPIRDIRQPRIEIRGEVNKDYSIEVKSKTEFTANLSKDWLKGDYSATAKIYLTTFDYLVDTDRDVPVSCFLQFTIPNGVTPSATPIPTPTSPAFCYDKDSQCNICASGCETCSWCKSKSTTRRPGINVPNLKPLCDQLGIEYGDKCWTCQKSGGIWSAIGCLPTDFGVLLKDYVFTYGMGIGGGIAFLYFLYGAFLILTSSGNAEQMEEAKQIIVSALSGLILIIFSIFLLKIIGVDILALPGFG